MKFSRKLATCLIGDGIRRCLASTALMFSLLLPNVASCQEVVDVIHPHERGGIGADQKSIEPFAAAARRTPPQGNPLDPRKSLFVTDLEIVEKITFSDVMDALAKDSGVSKLELFQQWWASAGTKQSTPTPFGPRCDDQSAPANGLSKLNGFPYRCPRKEEAEAKSDPFTNAEADQGYTAIAYSNRFDLADVSTTKDCGEYRIIFARNSGLNSGPNHPGDQVNRNLIIFEARVANPEPAKGLEGCRSLVQFWRNLSDQDVSTRAQNLRALFIAGNVVPGVPAIIRPENFTAASGQIRTNQFLDQGTEFDWTLREFKVRKLEPGLRIVPVTVKINPDASLFAKGASDPSSASHITDLQAKFTARMVDELKNLLGDRETLKLDLTRAGDDQYNSFESDERDDRGSASKSFDPNGPVGTYLAAKLKAIGSPLSAVQIVARAETQTCSGCHEFSKGDLGNGQNWPISLRFTHVTEREFDQAPSPETRRWKISPLIKELLLPQRCKFMADYLNAPRDLCNQSG